MSHAQSAVFATGRNENTFKEKPEKKGLDIDIEGVYFVKRGKKKGSANANVLSSRLKATRTSSKKSPKRKARWFSLRDQ